MTLPITSAESFADELRSVVERYMMHVEPTAEPQQYAVTMDVIGASMNVTFRKQPGERPYIQFTLHSQGTVDDTTTTASGLFGRRT